MTKLASVACVLIVFGTGTVYALPVGHEIARDVSRAPATRPAPGAALRRPATRPTTRPGTQLTTQAAPQAATLPATGPISIPVPEPSSPESERVSTLQRLARSWEDLGQITGTRVAIQVAYQQQTILHGQKHRKFRDAFRSESGRNDGALSYAVAVEQALWRDASVVVAFGGGAGNGLEKVFPTLSGLNDDIEPNVAYIGDAYLKQNFLGNKAYTATGLVQLSNWFDTNAVANTAGEQFSSSSLVNNPTIPLPYAAPGAVAGVKPNDWLYAQTAVVYNPSIGSFVPLHYSYLKEDYLLNLYELGLTPKIHNLQGNYRFLFWLDRRYDRLLPGTTRERDNRGFALSFDQQVTDRITMFCRYGLTSRAVLPIEDFWSVGAQLSAPLPGRKQDIFGVAMGQSLIDDMYRTGWRANAPAETVYEMYYRIKVTDYLAITPNLQFVTHPEAQRGSDCAVIGGIRIVLSL